MDYRATLECWLFTAAGRPPVVRFAVGQRGTISMTEPIGEEVFIQGITKEGRKFRPSDWAERLAGVMSQFRPGGVPELGGYLGYSPWCFPTQHGDIKCVVVHRDLQRSDPMAWDFVMNFARDNGLTVVEACYVDSHGKAKLPEPPKQV